MRRWYRWWWHRRQQRPIDELVASLAGFLGILLLIWLGQYPRNGYAVIFRSALAGGLAVLGVGLLVAQFKRYPERRRGLFLRLSGYFVLLLLLAELFRRWL